jgi:hypothetical protein
VLLVEPFEGWDVHGFHHCLKRAGEGLCEMWAKRVAKWGRVV